jgi:hypothetical protein
MKHLKKFFESSQSDADVLKEYFFNITDDLDNICEFEISQNNDNYFTVKISPKLKVTNTITQDSTNLINDWIVSNTNSSKILAELKSSISRLEDEDILEGFTLRKFLALGNAEGYILEIYTKLKSDQEAENWIFVEDDNTAWVDGLRLKKYMMSKFGVDFRHFELYEDYDRYNERYIQLTIHFSEPVQKSKLEEIKEVLLKKEVTNEFEESSFRIFTECHYPHYRDTANYIMFILHGNITDTQ